MPLHSMPRGRGTQFPQCYWEEREAQLCTCILNIVHSWHVDKTKFRHYNMYRNTVSKCHGSMYFWRKQHFSVPITALLRSPQHLPQNPAQPRNQTGLMGWVPQPWEMSAVNHCLAEAEVFFRLGCPSDCHWPSAHWKQAALLAQDVEAVQMLCSLQFCRFSL